MTALTPDAAERLDRLYRLHHEYVMRVARARTRDANAAQDVASETWVRAAASLPTLRASDETARAWLAAIAAHAATDYYRPKRAHERPMDWREPVTSRALPTTAAAEDQALTPQDDELPEPIQAAIRELPDAQRVTVQLLADGLSQRSMAARTGWDRARVRRQLTHAVTALRSTLTDAPTT